MAELFLVRHGQASFGTDDYDRLSSLGERQGVWLGEYFHAFGVTFDRVIIGTQRRHEQTAQAILQGMSQAQTTYERHAGLNEYDFEALVAALGEQDEQYRFKPGGDFKHYQKGLKEALRLWSEGRLTGALPETCAAFQQRVAAARQSIQLGSAKRVLAVSSGGAICTLIQQVLDAPFSTGIALNMQLRNSAVSHFFFNREAFHLAGFNAVPHLERPERVALRTYG